MNKKNKSYVIEGSKYTISDLYIKYVTKHGYNGSREAIRGRIRNRVNEIAKAHHKRTLEAIIGKA